VVFQRQERRDRQPRQADDAAQERSLAGVVGVLEAIAENRQRRAADRDGDDGLPVQEGRRHQHDDAIENRHGEPDRTEGVGEEDHQRQKHGQGRNEQLAAGVARPRRGGAAVNALSGGRVGARHRAAILS
jgi:hypothetical protein